MTETKLMQENLLKDIIFDFREARSQFPDWKQTVYDQITELYNYKLRYLIAQNTIETMEERILSDNIQSISNERN